jgi:HEPN domain-containing protein
MSERPERLRAEAWRWMRLARENLNVAELRQRHTEFPERHACFWAQQAAETAIKAVLVAEDVDPPKTHDLPSLAARCRASVVRDLDSDRLNALAAWAVGARYEPIGSDAASFEDAIDTARAALDAAAAAVENTVGPEPDQTKDLP